MYSKNMSGGIHKPQASHVKLQEPHRAFLSANVKADSTPCRYHVLSAVKLKSLCCVLNRVVTHFLREKNPEFRSSASLGFFF